MAVKQDVETTHFYVGDLVSFTKDPIEANYILIDTDGLTARLAPIGDDIVFEIDYARLREPIPCATPEIPLNADVDFDSKDFRRALDKYECIKPILQERISVAKQAKKIGKSSQTLRTYLRAYREAGNIMGLFRQQRSDSGTTKLAGFDKFFEEQTVVKFTNKVLSLLNDRSEEKWLKIDAATKIRDAYIDKHPTEEPPHVNSVVNRINVKIDSYLRALGYSNVRDKYGRVDWVRQPLQFVQIDHAVINIPIVDRVFRKKINKKVYITIAIDVATRMVAGFYLSLNPPSALSVAMVMHSIGKPKARLAVELGIPYDGQGISGVPGSVGIDNASEFWGKGISYGCNVNLIDIHYRKAGKPKYGGHIERLIGIVKLKFLKHFADKDVPLYQSDAMTLLELEAYLWDHILNVYHVEEHSQLGESPVECYDRLRKKNSEGLSIGHTRPVRDPLTYYCDFLPVLDRKINGGSIKFNSTTYYSEELAEVVVKYGRDLTIKRSPSDISRVFVKHPKKHYYIVAESSLRPISEWELKQIRKWLKKNGEDTTPAAVNDTVTRLEMRREDARNLNTLYYNERAAGHEDVRETFKTPKPKTASKPRERRKPEIDLS